MIRKALVYFEIDIDYCSNTYGVAPCTAAVGVTGDAKCFNTLNTCQDRSHYANAPVTLRFRKDEDYYPSDIPAISSIQDVAFTPGMISLGEDLGTRSTLSVTFRDHPSGDAAQGLDKYWTTRGYDPFKQGTFWGKFRARNPFLRGRACRLIIGYVGQALADMETRHFVMDSSTGPTPDGAFTITAKDVLKYADDDRAQAPRPSNGSLLADLTNSATSFTISPSGIGNAEYPSSGYIAVGGKEIMSFTRSGDVFTITRAQYNTTAIAHKASDAVQLCLLYSAADPADVIKDLLVTYAGVPSTYITIANWQAESAAYLGRVITTLIAQPVGVNSLLKEIIQQTASVLWWDDRGRQVRFQVLRSIPTDSVVFDESGPVMEGSLTVQDQPDKRISQCYVLFAQRNPLEPLDSETNYRCIYLGRAGQEESDYGSPAIRKIYSRWIPQLGTSIAERISDIVLSRYKNPPRAFSFDYFRKPSGSGPLLGGGCQLEWGFLQDASGARVTVPMQVTRINPKAERYVCEAEEVIFSGEAIDLLNRKITIDINSTNLNLRTIHDTQYPVITDPTGITVECIINEGVSVSSVSSTLVAFEIGDWPHLPTIIIRIRGRIQGAGGRGGWATNPDAKGTDGGTALRTRVAIQLDNTGGELWGGGGGGGGLTGGTGGGGGAGNIPGQGGASYPNTGPTGTSGTTEAAGLGYTTTVSTEDGRSYSAGNGGGPGLAGVDASSSPPGGTIFPTRPGGAAGKAIDGDSYVTVLALGDLRGQRTG